MALYKKVYTLKNELKSADFEFANNFKSMCYAL